MLHCLDLCNRIFNQDLPVEIPDFTSKMLYHGCREWEKKHLKTKTQYLKDRHCNKSIEQTDFTADGYMFVVVVVVVTVVVVLLFRVHTGIFSNIRHSFH